MLVVFPREIAAVLSYTTATRTRGTINSSNNKNNNSDTFSTNVTAFFCVNGLKNYQCTVCDLYEDRVACFDSSSGYFMVVSVVEFSREGYKVKKNFG